MKPTDFVSKPPDTIRICSGSLSILFAMNDEELPEYLSLNQTQAKLIYNINNAPSRPCAAQHTKAVTVKATFDPAYCHSHRHMDENVHKAGWCYITSQEAKLLTFLLGTHLFFPCFQALYSFEIERPLTDTTLQSVVRSFTSTCATDARIENLPVACVRCWLEYENQFLPRLLVPLDCA